MTNFGTPPVVPTTSLQKAISGLKVCEREQKRILDLNEHSKALFLRRVKYAVAVG